jgi:hypothetical protein
MPTINRLVQQIARIRFGSVVRFSGTTVAALPAPATGKDRFSILGKLSPLVSTTRCIPYRKDEKPPFNVLGS